MKVQMTLLKPGYVNIKSKTYTIPPKLREHVDALADDIANADTMVVHTEDDEFLIIPSNILKETIIRIVEVKE